MKNQKGFANLVLLGAILVLGMAGYFAWRNNFFGSNSSNQHLSVETRAQDTSTWKTYSNAQYGFELKYPPIYRFLELNNSTYVQFFTGASEAGTVLSVRVSKYSLAQEEATIKAYPQVSQFSKKNVSVSGSDFTVMTYDYTSMNGGPIQHFGEALAEHNGSVYVVKHFSETLSEDMFNQILLTFKFNK